MKKPEKLSATKLRKLSHVNLRWAIQMLAEALGCIVSAQFNLDLGSGEKASEKLRQAETLLKGAAANIGWATPRVLTIAAKERVAEPKVTRKKTKTSKRPSRGQK